MRCVWRRAVKAPRGWGPRLPHWALLFALPALPSIPTCMSYKNDVEKVCDAEHASGISPTAPGNGLFDWLTKNVATPDGVVLVNELSTKSPRDRAVQLRSEARKFSIAACPLADAYDAQAKGDDSKQDLANLCNQRALLDTGSVALLDISTAPDDAERLREIREWVAANAKTDMLTPVVAKLSQAAPKDRGAVLRAEAQKGGMTTCPLADALARPPPPPPKPAAPQPQPTFAVAKFDGSKKYGTAVTDALKANSDAVLGCYAVGLARDPKLAGKVAVRVTVDPNGRPQGASGDGSSLSDSKVVSCIVNVMGGTVYTKSPDSKAEKFTLTLALSTTTSMGVAPNFTIPGAGKR